MNYLEPPYATASALNAYILLRILSRRASILLHARNTAVDYSLPLLFDAFEIRPRRIYDIIRMIRDMSFIAISSLPPLFFEFQGLKVACGGDHFECGRECQNAILH